MKLSIKLHLDMQSVLIYCGIYCLKVSSVFVFNDFSKFLFHYLLDGIIPNLILKILIIQNSTDSILLNFPRMVGGQYEQMFLLFSIKIIMLIICN